MPYHLKGNCVVKDTGQVVKCHENHDKALAHLRALYANVEEAKEIEPSDTYVHGPGGILSQPGQTAKKKKKKVISAMMTPKEFASHFQLSEKDFGYALDELWSLDNAVEALSFLLRVAQSEINDQETEDTQRIIDMIHYLNDFISDQLEEASGALQEETGENDVTEDTSKELGGYLVEADGKKYLPTRVNGKLSRRHLAAARAALTSNYRGNPYKGPHKREALAKLKKLYAEAGMDWEEKESDVHSQFLTTKEGDHLRWVMITSSNFRDRDGEIISAKALEEDCDEMERTGQYGELLWWHCDGDVHGNEKEARPYIPIGVCDTSLVFEGLNIESGLYYDKEVGEYFQEHADEFGASKAFYHPANEPDTEGVYHHIRTKERSILPRSKESNVLTRLFSFGFKKEKEMATNKERIEALEKRLGADKVKELLEKGKQMSEQAKAYLESKEAKGNEEPDGLGLILQAVKEYSERQEVAYKELKAQLEEWKALSEKQASQIEALKGQLSDAKRVLDELMGLQPKAHTRGFLASVQGTPRELTEEQKKMDKEARGELTGMDSLSHWLLTGSHQKAL